MPGEYEELAKLAYFTFVGCCASRHLLPWEELPPLIQDSWRTVVQVISEDVLHSEDVVKTEETHVKP